WRISRWVNRRSRLPADGPGVRAAALHERRGALVLLGLRGGGGVAGAADGLPGLLVELVLAAVRARRVDGARVAARLAGGDRLEAGRRRARGGRGGGLRGLALEHAVALGEPLAVAAHVRGVPVAQLGAAAALRRDAAKPRVLAVELHVARHRAGMLVRGLACDVRDLERGVPRDGRGGGD